MSLLIVDDHASFRSFARMLLTAEGFDVTGEAQDGASAIEAAGRLRPDVVLLDVQLPDMDGFEVAQRLSTLVHAPRVVLTSSREASDFGHRLTGAPARGFIPKQDLSGPALAELLQAA